MIETAIIAHLLASPEVTALVETRIYPSPLPQKPKMPAISYQRANHDRALLLAEKSDVVVERLQIDAWAETLLDVRILDEAILNTLHGLTDSISGIKLVQALPGSDSYEEDTKLRRVSRDYEITGKE